MESQIQTKDGNNSRELNTYQQSPQHAYSSMAAVREKLYAILQGFVLDGTSKIHPEAKLRDDLGIDSLDMIEMIMICEKDFFLDLPDKHWTRSKTVFDLEQLIFKSLIG